MVVRQLLLTNRATLQEAMDLMPQIGDNEFKLDYMKIKTSTTEPLDKAGFTKTAPPGTNKAVCILGDWGQANPLLT